MVFHQDLRRVTDIIHTKLLVGLALLRKFLRLYSGGVTSYTSDCIMYVDKCYVFWQQKVGRTKDNYVPHLNLVHECRAYTIVESNKAKGVQPLKFLITLVLWYFCACAIVGESYTNRILFEWDSLGTGR